MNKFKVEKHKVLSTHLPDDAKHTDKQKRVLKIQQPKPYLRLASMEIGFRSKQQKTKILLRDIIYVLFVEKYNKLTNLL